MSTTLLTGLEKTVFFNPHTSQEFKSFKLNDALQKALREYKAEINKNIIVRCDSLPAIVGNEQLFESSSRTYFLSFSILQFM